MESELGRIYYTGDVTPWKWNNQSHRIFKKIYIPYCDSKIYISCRPGFTHATK